MTSISQNSPITLLRRKQVEARTGLSRSTIYAYISAGTFPPPIHLGGVKSVAWIEEEINDWIRSQITESRRITTTENSQ